MKKTLLLLVAVAALIQGCAVESYSRQSTNPDGTREVTTASANGLFTTRHLTKLNVDKKTAKTYTGLSAGSADSDVDAAAMQIFAQGVAAGLVQGAGKAVVPVP